MRRSTRAGWAPWCAGALLAILALSVLHSALPHKPLQRDCYACKALQSPGLAQAMEAQLLPEPPRSPLPPAPTVRSLLLRARSQNPLRAPPPLS